MKTPIEALRQQFNETIGQWIGFLDHYTLAQLQYRPSEEAWSLGQVYVHLIEDTEYFVEQIITAMGSGTEHATEPMHPEAKRFFAANAFPDLKIENPYNRLDLPQPASTEELRVRLVRIRDRVNGLTEEPAFSTSVGKTAHPGLRYFSAQEWLQFAEMHLRHHLRQKDRISGML
ncbi:DinB family protein [Siphonobacter aquaeclarae]|jgi:hypothetical protein|uniref:DinB superfamily protein n=1 Tax=Siphonobacter aquaeclarae TaxID=563176 RepID=A0A1G9MIU5_9BACT|nr:DinB family protein [Siphonobacter aquaeclarae]SDL74188.1 DinB superfamily protein [Siphonobacter aquaeclarae]